jgi:ribonuclease HI
MELTVNLPDGLVSRLKPFQKELPDILELGLRKWKGNHCAELEGVADVLEALANLPSPQEVLALRPSEALQNRISILLEKNQREGLSANEEKEWEYYAFLEHLVRLAKGKAAHKLKAS